MMNWKDGKTIKSSLSMSLIKNATAKWVVLFGGYTINEVITEVVVIKDIGRIIICGGNGAGKSTLGAELAKRINVPFFDIEDFYFPDKTKEYGYDAPRSKKEVENI